jgi:hypothetical protein
MNAIADKSVATHPIVMPAISPCISLIREEDVVDVLIGVAGAGVVNK